MRSIGEVEAGVGARHALQCLLRVPHPTALRAATLPTAKTRGEGKRKSALPDQLGRYARKMVNPRISSTTKMITKI